MSSEPKDYQASSNSNLSSTTPGAPLNQSLTASSTNEGVSCKKNVDTNISTNDQIESQHIQSDQQHSQKDLGQNQCLNFDNNSFATSANHENGNLQTMVKLEPLGSETNPSTSHTTNTNLFGSSLGDLNYSNNLLTSTLTTGDVTLPSFGTTAATSNLAYSNNVMSLQDSGQNSAGSSNSTGNTTKNWTNGSTKYKVAGHGKNGEASKRLLASKQTTTFQEFPRISKG